MLSKLFCFLMAFHFFNVCIDMPDPEPDSKPEDLTINDQESIVEFFAENVFGLENAFAEHDEPDSDDNFQVNKDFKVYPKSFAPLQFVRFYVELPCSYPNDTKSSLSFIRDIVPPPPKA